MHTDRAVRPGGAEPPDRRGVVGPATVVSPARFHRVCRQAATSLGGRWGRQRWQRELRWCRRLRRHDEADASLRDGIPIGRRVERAAVAASALGFAAAAAHGVAAGVGKMQHERVILHVDEVELDVQLDVGIGRHDVEGDRGRRRRGWRVWRRRRRRRMWQRLRRPADAAYKKERRKHAEKRQAHVQPHNRPPRLRRVVVHAVRSHHQRCRAAALHRDGSAQQRLAGRLSLGLRDWCKRLHDYVATPCARATHANI